MKLREFIENLNQFVKENPDALELDVITSIDSEGNGYNEVYYEPSKGNFDGNSFVASDQFPMWMDETDINSVCIN